MYSFDFNSILILVFRFLFSFFFIHLSLCCCNNWISWGSIKAFFLILLYLEEVLYYSKCLSSSVNRYFHDCTITPKTAKEEHFSRFASLFDRSSRWTFPELSTASFNHSVAPFKAPEKDGKWPLSWRLCELFLNVWFVVDGSRRLFDPELNPSSS